MLAVRSFLVSFFRRISLFPPTHSLGGMLRVFGRPTPTPQLREVFLRFVSSEFERDDTESAIFRCFSMVFAVWRALSDFGNRWFTAPSPRVDFIFSSQI